MIHVVIIVVVAADHDHELREIYALEAERFRQQVEDARRGQIYVCCDLCWIWENYYSTPGRAKMGLSGHQQWCRRRR